MTDDLALSMRPRTFEEMIGAERLIKKIRGLFERGKIPKAWMFYGPTGSGKTTIARIMAVSLQCRHQKVFGHPCRRCRHDRKFFDIVEINASDITGIDGMRDAVQGAYYAPKPGSYRRVYILDECHKLSDSSQNLLLKFTEDCPRTTNWIFCTTRADNIIDTLQSRCTIYKVPGLELEGIKDLVKKGLKELHSDRSVSELAERLMEKGITSPRLVIKAVQKYADKEVSADEASEVTLTSDVDIYAVCRAVIKGEWEAVAKLLSKAEDAISIQRGVAGYLNAILLAETNFSPRTKVVANAILQLNGIGNSMPATSAVLWKLCKYFSKEPR